MIVGSAIGSYFAQKKILSPDDLSFFQANGPAIVGAVMAVGGAIWGLIARKQSNVIASVAAMTDIKPADQAVLAATVAELPSVGKVVGAPNAAGDALAAAAPSASVVPAGS